MVKLKKQKASKSSNETRRITLKKKKVSRKKEIFITIFLAGLMILSIFAIMIGGYNSQDVVEEYNGYEFQLINSNGNQIWRTKINDEVRDFNYLPSQLENINLTEQEKSLFKTDMFGIKFDPESENIEYVEAFRFYFAEQFINMEKQLFFSVSNNQTEGYENFPVYGCNESIPLVELNVIPDHSSQSSSITQNQYCVVVNSRINDIVPIVERLTYLALGVMN